MIHGILDALFGNPYWFVFFIGIIVSFLIGLVAFDEKTEKSWMFGIIFAVAWMIIGGLLLLEIWAILTISNFFGIPLLVMLALIVVAVAAVAVIKWLLITKKLTLVMQR